MRLATKVAIGLIHISYCSIVSNNGSINDCIMLNYNIPVGQSFVIIATSGKYVDWQQMLPLGTCTL